jgi:hypothetical protein
MRRLLALAIALTCCAPAFAADPNTPHPHQGVIAAYSGAPPTVDLDAADLATLAEGKPVMKQQKLGDAGGRGIAVQDVHATTDQVWAKILNYPMYPEWVDGVYECEEYKVDGHDHYVRFVIGAMMIKVEYYIKHDVEQEKGYLTWTLDYSRTSDLDDSVGFWRVEPIADKPGWTRVFYSVQIKMSGWVPGWVEDMLAKSGLTKATEWVKRESEKG